MALAQNTDFIVLDEPTTYLDISHQLEVLELLKKLNIQQHRTWTGGSRTDLQLLCLQYAFQARHDLRNAGRQAGDHAGHRTAFTPDMEESLNSMYHIDTCFVFYRIYVRFSAKIYVVR